MTAKPVPRNSLNPEWLARAITQEIDKQLKTSGHRYLIVESELTRHIEAAAADIIRKAETSPCHVNNTGLSRGR